MIQSQRTKKWLIKSLFVALLLGGSFSTRSVSAGIREIPQSLAHSVLSESVPTAFEVFPLRAKDFSVSWLGKSPDGIQVTVIPGSIQWVRISQLIVLPRGLIRVTGTGWDAITVQSGSFVESASAGKALELPMSLFSAGESIAEARIQRNGVIESYPFRLTWNQPQEAPLQRFFIDSSCSSFFPEVLGAEKIPKGQWAYLGCRVVRNRLGGNEVPTLELYLHWDGDVEELKVNGLPLKGEVAGLHIIRLSAERPRVELSLGSGPKLQLKFQLPPRLNYASLGLGVGPYSFYFEDSVSSVSRTLPIATMYGSYFLTESSRIVFFNAFAPGSRWYNDIGFYFNNESSRALDDRLSFNLLLGFHVIGFKASSGVAYRLGVPQGFEMIFRDAFKKRYSASAGGFFYPPIAGKTYYNSWVRFGNPQLFGEINYIAWSELGPENERVYSRSLGITLGAPLFFFR
jgi:hypothetical protein